ncbi:FecR domain-containing protein [Calycomorphotria hydatis]|uniref:FecR protein n=1 Tax=Calycomorphotria hydatis TaxID=2528027 RepID=A0A517TEL2_9PLAN|nr:FecR domain-containing protein [Calycomorphotria hydatis]QDT66806.1 FecR protein [Calycomorphotria hydatis]
MPDQQMNNEEFQRLLHRLVDSPLDQVDAEALEKLLLNNPERQDLFLDYMWLDSSLLELGEVHNDVPELALKRSGRQRGLIYTVVALASCTVACLIAVAVLVSQSFDQQVEMVEVRPADGAGKTVEVPVPQAEEVEEVELISNARIVGGYHAVFRGASTPMNVGSRFRFRQDYVLKEGMTKVVFASGAEAIIQAPAVFQIVSDEELVMNLGGCSVYAPDGAEGFKVSTPTSDIVDLGTRFSVVVTVDGASDIAVVDGEAEVSSHGKAQKKILLKNDGARIGPDLQLVERQGVSPGGHYVSAIPDHLLSYEAEQDSLGRDVKLKSLCVQRGGVQHVYQDDDFILPEINHYVAGSQSVGVVPADAPADAYNRFGPMDLLFASGFINPGGSVEFHKEDIVLGRDGTPGINIVFSEPVVNSPGPDIVLFDAQSVVQSLEGDPFHLYPVTDLPGATPITVSEYDINGHSAEVRLMTGCRLSYFGDSYAEDGTPLPNMKRSQLVNKIPSHMFAVGIDLDDMNIPQGESVSGVFLQDAMDDENFIDPVVIVGLPPTK